jgi:uncharacterized protein
MVEADCVMGQEGSVTAPSNIKVIECDEYAAVFSGQDMTLKLLPLQLYLACTSEGEGDYVQGAAETFLSLCQAQASLGNLLPSCPTQPSNSRPKRDPRPVLHRLTLNISNTCNMTCKYCYANGGAYYTRGMLMNRDTALNAVNVVSRNFSMIDHVNFFGGEPTLNQPIIEMVCEYFIYLHTRGVLPYLPQFGLTTNGYAMDKDMLKVLRTYSFSVTVSVDGPQEIHDRVRVSKDGSGTYAAIVENVKTVIGMGIVPEFECTYTGEHYRSGIDPATLMDFFHDSFQCRTLHCPMVIAEPTSRWFIPLESATELYADAIRYSMRNLARGIPRSVSVATRLLNSLATKTPICHYCPAGKSTLTVNADGNVYACFMLMNGAGFCLGNVNGEEQGLSYPDSISAVLKDADKWQNPACRDCWAQSLCFGCLGEDLAREGPVVHRSVIPGRSGLCDFKRKLVEVFLMSAAEACLR